jgi:SagB-type dehydrogenase family enzyme
MDLFQLGVNSVEIIRIANLLDNELGFRPRIDEFYRNPTLGGLTQAYEQHLQQILSNDNGGQEQLPDELAPFKEIIDPVEREEFKKLQLGLRQGDDHVPRIPLLLPGPDAESTYRKRRSYRQFLQKPIPFAQLSQFLSCLRQVSLDGKTKYLYPSAGSAYPVQTYLHIKPGRIEGLEGGIYYYHPVKHDLVLLSADATLDRNIHDPLINGPIFDQAAFSLFLIAQLRSILPLYGERSRHFATLETGYIGQLLMNAAIACQIGLCPIGSLDFERIRHLFALEPSHWLVHTLLGGQVDASHTGPWSPLQESYYALSMLDEREEGEL